MKTVEFYYYGQHLIVKLDTVKSLFNVFKKDVRPYAVIMELVFGYLTRYGDFITEV